MGTCQAVIDGNTCECGFESESVNEFAGDNCKKNRNDQLILSEFRIVLLFPKVFFLILQLIFILVCRAEEFVKEYQQKKSGIYGSGNQVMATYKFIQSIHIIFLTNFSNGLVTNLVAKNIFS